VPPFTVSPAVNDPVILVMNKQLTNDNVGAGEF